MNFFSLIFRTLYGDLTKAEGKKFGLLSITLAFIVGTYWLLRPLKDAIFMNMVGRLWLPSVKVVSIFVLIPLILFYSKLVDIFEKQKLLYIITIFYGFFFISIAYLLQHPTIGLANTIPSAGRLLGWIVYVGIESFVSLVVALFWSFVTSTTDTASAKRGYALIIAGAQIGTIIGPEFSKHATNIGIPQLFVIAAGAIFSIPLSIKFIIKMQPNILNIAQHEQPRATGFFEGIRLLFSDPYLLGIFCVSTTFGVIESILEIQMNYLASSVYQSTEKIAEFLGVYGQSINIITLFLALFGTGFLIRRFGLTISLVAYPVFVGILICCTWVYPTLQMLFFSLVFIKCLCYALNIPCKEMLYIPTSRDVRFKVKGWIDTIGDRLTKGMGGSISIFLPTMAHFVCYGSVISLAFVGVWISAALYVGKRNKELLLARKIIE